MLTSLTSAVSGLDSFQEEMDVIGNNIANVNTTGYKAADVSFVDAFSDTLRVASGATTTTSGSSSIQVGTGVAIAAIDSNWTQGAINTTGVTSNLAISGNGFFQVRDTVTNDEYVTRAGDFSLDANGYLVSDTGERVQGYTDGTLAATGDIKIDATGNAAAAGSSMVSYSIDGQGKIHVNMSDGTSFVRGQVLMDAVSDPQSLSKQGNNLFGNLAAAGTSNLTPPGSNGLGTVQSGALEGSNVDLSGEMANLITAQRAFEANSKIITTSDELLQTLVNLKR